MGVGVWEAGEVEGVGPRVEHHSQQEGQVLYKKPGMSWAWGGLYPLRPHQKDCLRARLRPSRGVGLRAAGKTQAREQKRPGR